MLWVIHLKKHQEIKNIPKSLNALIVTEQEKTVKVKDVKNVTILGKLEFIKNTMATCKKCKTVLINKTKVFPDSVKEYPTFKNDLRMYTFLQ